MPETILTDKAPTPNGHYSQAVTHGGVVYVSCQLGFSGPEKTIPQDFREEALQCLKNIKEIVIASGGNISSILRVTIYVTNISLWPEVNTIYAEFMGTHKPARSVIPVVALHCNARIGIEAIAAAVTR